MYEKHLVKWGINLVWSPKALPEYPISHEQV